MTCRPIRLMLPILLLAGLGTAPSNAAGLAAGATQGAAAFTPAQRAEIVAIVRQALQQDPSILRDAVIAMQNADNAESRQASRAAIAQAGSQLVTPADPVAGDPNGNVTIVEFFDTRCPYCRKLDPEMSKLLGQDHHVRLVYKDLPILGPASVLGSKALLAAQRQGAYAAMRAAVMKLPPDTTMDQLQSTARDLHLDWPRMQHDMNDPAIQARLDQNIALARTLGIQGTPALVIGGDLIPGAVDLADLQKAVTDARR